jgi:hypothetical protein
MISFRRVSELATNKKKWIWIGLVAVPGIHFYYVQEMIAALIMFSVVFVVAFVVVAAFVLIIFLLDRASQHVMAWTEAGVARVLHRVVDAVEDVIASPAWAQTVPHRFPKGTTEGEREELKAVYLRSPSVEGGKRCAMYLRAGFDVTTTRRYRFHRVPASQAHAVVFLNSVGFTHTDQLFRTDLSFPGRTETLPIQRCFSRPTDMVVG